MKRVLVTGASGFIGRNICARLINLKGIEVLRFDLEHNELELEASLSCAEVIFHLAGVNRSVDDQDFEEGNAGLTRQICGILAKLGRTPKIVMSSSVQAELDNPYGVSKLRAERILQAYSKETGASVCIYRLKNIFGKWCRPEYNSVTATFCHNIANDLPISISDPTRKIDLVYIEDIVDCFISELDSPGGPRDCFASQSIPSTCITLGELAGRIQTFQEISTTLRVPDFSSQFNRRLYATYLSYVSPTQLEYGLDVKTDSRGCLAEFIKSKHFGQIFVSRTRPGITRGNHYHLTKTEKFFVLVGTGLIRMRHLEEDDVEEYQLNGSEYRVVDIPPGYAHSISNVGKEDLITLFWSSELFDPDHPDTYFHDIDACSRHAGLA